MRDSMGDDVTAMYVGDDVLYDRLLKLVRLRGDLPERKIVHYTGKRAMMREYGISPLVFAAAQPPCLSITAVISSSTIRRR